jgi:hypothetical protein
MDYLDDDDLLGKRPSALEENILKDQILAALRILRG